MRRTCWGREAPFSLPTSPYPESTTFPSLCTSSSMLPSTGTASSETSIDDGEVDDDHGD
jgi:hypothetical protein